MRKYKIDGSNDKKENIEYVRVCIYYIHKVNEIYSLKRL